MRREAVKAAPRLAVLVLAAKERDAEEGLRSCRDREADKRWAFMLEEEAHRVSGARTRIIGMLIETVMLSY